MKTHKVVFPESFHLVPEEDWPIIVIRNATGLVRVILCPEMREFTWNKKVADLSKETDDEFFQRMQRALFPESERRSRLTYGLAEKIWNKGFYPIEDMQLDLIWNRSDKLWHFTGFSKREDKPKIQNLPKTRGKVSFTDSLGKVHSIPVLE